MQPTTFPSGPIKQIEGHCIYLKGNDIDTDRIIPARFLKCISFEELGKQVFADDRKEKNSNHPFNLMNNNASILIVNKNFGCGSSREHAPQALMRWGIRAIIGESFAEIFYSNCLSIGMPCATISDSILELLVHNLNNSPTDSYKLDLKEQTLNTTNECYQLSLEKASLNMLLTGRWDATSILMEQEEQIKLIKSNLPYLNNFTPIG